VTAWGEAVWGNEQLATTFDDAKGEKFDKNYVDSQTLVTAQRLGVPLVTGDKHLIKKARRNGVPVMSATDVLALALEMTAD
jgi:rRNA-processing protein FCF1